MALRKSCIGFFKHHKTFTHTELFSNLSNESRATVCEKSWHFVKWLQNKQRTYSKWWYSLRALLFGKKFLMVSGFVSIDMTPSISADFSEIPVLFFFQKFGTIRADLIEQMRFKQRLKVILLALVIFHLNLPVLCSQYLCPFKMHMLKS